MSNWYICEVCGARNNGAERSDMHRNAAHPEEARQQYIASLTYQIGERTEQLERDGIRFGSGVMPWAK